MTDITLHLTANFYPPIPHDIQMAVQEFFDEIVEDGMPWMILDSDDCIVERDLHEPSVLDRTKTLPNGAIITGHSMIDELRLWDALFYDIEPQYLDSDPQLQYAESKEYPGQLSFWEDE